MFLMGHACYAGVHVGTTAIPVDKRKGIELMERAASLGNLNGHHCLGEIYHRGDGAVKDLMKAKQHLEAAAIGGHTDGRHLLGIVEREMGNLKRAFGHYKIAARAGHDLSLKNVKTAYQIGQCLPFP